MLKMNSVWVRVCGKTINFCFNWYNIFVFRLNYAKYPHHAFIMMKHFKDILKSSFSFFFFHFMLPAETHGM